MCSKQNTERNTLYGDSSRTKHAANLNREKLPVPPPKEKPPAVYVPGSITDDPDVLCPLPKDYVAYGAMGSGKTRLAGTWSDDWPTEIPAKEVTYLDDIAWIRCDKGAIDSLLALKIRPRYSIDLLKLLTPLQPGEPDRPVARDILQAIDWTLKELQFYATEKGVRKVVWDTVSSLMDFLTSFWLSEENCPTTKGGRTDPQAGWGRVKRTFFTLWQTQTVLQYRCLWLAHPTENFDETAIADSKGFAKKGQETVTCGDYGKIGLVQNCVVDRLPPTAVFYR